MTFALVGTTVVVLLLLTYAAFRYVPTTLAGEGREESAETREPPEGRLAD